MISTRDCLEMIMMELVEHTFRKSRVNLSKEMNIE